MRKRNFRKFINDCYVDHSIGNIYHVVSNVDEEVFISVRHLGDRQYEIEENSFFDIKNDVEREMVFLKIDSFLDELEPEKPNDYEHPGIAGGIYSDYY